MVRTIICILIALFLVSYASANENGNPISNEQMTDEKPTYCPKTLMSKDCLTCHVAPTFELKETDPYAKYNLPWNSKIIDGKLVYELNSVVQSSGLEDVIDYMSWHPEFKELVFEIHSPGGSLAEAWKMVSLMQALHDRGIKITTRVPGFAASAAFILFCAGDIGSREIGKLAEIMHHELWTATFLSIDTPSSKENEAKTLRHLQDTIHKWLLTRCTKEMTMDELNAMVHHKDYWMRSAEAIEAGFADKYIGE